MPTSPPGGREGRGPGDFSRIARRLESTGVQGLRTIAAIRSVTHHVGMVEYSSRFLRLAPVLALILTNATAYAAERPARLFGTVDEALAVVRTLGPDWQNPQEGPQIPVYRGLRERRFLFGKHNFAIVSTDNRGIVRKFHVVTYTPIDPDDRTHPRKCSNLPDHERLAALLLNAAEPNHSPKDLNMVKSAARLGWTPVLGQKGAKVNNTVFLFMSYSKKCAVEVSEYKPLRST